MHQTTSKLAKKAKIGLDTNYSYLAGNALSRDKKGRVTSDDTNMASEMQAAGHVGGEEYTAYVYYEFEIAQVSTQGRGEDPKMARIVYLDYRSVKLVEPLIFLSSLILFYFLQQPSNWSQGG